MAHFGAKILHPTSILPARQKEHPGTTIEYAGSTGTRHADLEAADTGRIKAVAAKDDITYLKIRSTYKVPGYRFLDKVFHCFARSHTPIDLMVTSDTEISPVDRQPEAPAGNRRRPEPLCRRYGGRRHGRGMRRGRPEWYNVGFEHRIVDSLKDIPRAHDLLRRQLRYLVRTAPE